MGNWKNSRKGAYKNNYKPFIAVILVLLCALSLIVYIPSLLNKTSPLNSDKPVDNPKNETIISNIIPIIVNKKIPSGYTMGFPIEAGMVNGMNANMLKNATDKISIRFTSFFSGDVESVVIYGQAIQGRPKVVVGIQSDIKGSPSGAWLANEGFGSIELNSTLKFVKIKLGNSANLEQGQVYHIVIEPSEDYSGIAAVMSFVQGGQGLPYNGTDPDIILSDLAVDTLFFEGDSWVIQNGWPVFIVSFVDGRSEGQPYSLEAQWVIYGSTYVGQTIIPASGFSLGKVAFVMNLIGHPKDKLYYRILDSTGTVLSIGIFAESTHLDNFQRWIEVNLSSPVPLKPGQLYRLVVYSPETDLDNCYMMYGYEFCYDSSIGYGGLQHQLTISLDGGRTWGEWTDADAVFKLTSTS